MKERPALGVLSVACLLFSMSLLVGTLVLEFDVAGAYTPHAPIYIDGNANFTAANGVTGGSGTPSDPYTIEGWEISASTTGGIDIRNTDAHFIIRDTFTHSGGTSNSGISLWNVTSGVVENNTASDNWCGISLREASNNLLVNNTIDSNRDCGIQIYASSNNTLANNTASSNWEGIRLPSSSNNLLVNNNASSNEWGGIDLTFSYNNTLANNSVSDNYYGILLYYASNDTLVNNSISNNTFGIYLALSNASTFMNNVMLNDGIMMDGDFLVQWTSHEIDTSNTVNGKPVYYWKNRKGGAVPPDAGEVILANCTSVSVENENVSDGSVGILLGFSNNSYIANNTASNSAYGIFLSFSGNNTLVDNNASDDGIGISLSSFGGNTIANNIIIDDESGISIADSSANIVVNNTVADNYNGISAYYSDVNTLAYNTISSSDYEGIYLYYSSNNTLADNTATSNREYGIHLDSSSYNTVTDNTVGSNYGYGIYLYYSHSNFLGNNTANSNRMDGISLSRSDSDALMNNTVSSNSLYGISLHDSVGITLTNNTVSSNDFIGIYLDSSIGNTLADNTMESDGIMISGSQLMDWNTHEIGTSNTVNGKPVHYWRNQSNGAVPPGAGEVILANCTNILVENENMSDGSAGILLGFTNSSTVANNNASNDYYGIFLANSNGNSIVNNTASYNRFGISLTSSGGNTIVNNTVARNEFVGITLISLGGNSVHHNNFIGNVNQAEDDMGTEDSWDNSYPSGGNYWSDYAGRDLFGGVNQDQPGSDGIGDTPYIIDLDSRDRYPLMAPVGAQLPDLAVTPSNISFSQPPPLQEGSSVVINATIWNLGSFSSKQTTVRFYDGFPPSTQIGSDQTLDPIPAGGSQNFSVTWIASPPGSHQICVAADPDNLVTESSETNNMACEPATVFSLPTLPDLVPLSFDVTPSSPITENTVAQLNVTVRNVGDLEATNFAILFFEDLNGNRLPDAGENITETALPRLSGHGQIGITEPWIAYPPGIRDICVMVDYRDRVSESNEANNVACLRIDVLFSLQLTPGHRFMSFPVAVADDDIAEVLSSIAGCYDYVRWYDPLDSLDHWKSYTPGRAYNDLARLDNAMGFWINVTATCSFTPVGTRPVSTTIALRQGWNMVGFPSFRTTYTVADLKADLGLAGVLVEAFDLNATSYNLQRVKDSYVMMAGEGYWIYVPSDTTWIVGG